MGEAGWLTVLLQPKTMPLTQKQLDARSRINTAFSNIAAKIAVVQGVYFAQYGRYCQFLETNPGVSLGTKTKPNRKHRPSDENDDLESLGVTFPATMDFSLRCDVYQSPGEHGYTLAVTTQDGDVKASRTRLEQGTETSRTRAWAEEVKEEV